MRRARVAAVIGLWLGWAALRGVCAAEIDAGTYAVEHPDGFPGTLLLCGPRVDAARVLATIPKKHLRDELLIVADAGAEELPVRLEQWATAGFEQVRVLSWGTDGKVAPLPAVEQVGVLWLHAGKSVESQSPLAAWRELAATVLDRGGMVIRSGCLSADRTLPGFNVVSNDVTIAEATAAGSVALRLLPGGLLLVSKRRCSIPGKGLPAVELALAGLETRAAKVMSLDGGESLDLTALRRAAAARAMPPFPPETCALSSVEQGALLIVGGGELTPELLHTFIERAGGGNSRIALVPTAAEDPASDRKEEPLLRKAGAGELFVLHAATRKEASSEEFLNHLRQATGVWITGGRQWRLVDRYEGTPVVEELHALLARGGIIAGSSAGATIQGGYLVRGSPLGNEEMMAEGYERGFAFLPGTAIDQHFSQRGRMPDMRALKQQFPQLLGIGLDESTAILVTGNKARVLGEGAAMFFDRAPTEADAGVTVAHRGDTYLLTPPRGLKGAGESAQSP